MFKLFKNLKPMSILLIIVIVLVAGQAVAELYLPEKMSEIIDDGIYLDYEPLYKHEEMDKPSGISGVDSEKTLKGYDSDKIPVFEMIDGFSTYDLAEALQEADPDAIVDITFQDIPVKDSKELFDDVITPFLDGLKPYQSPGADFYDFSEADQRKIASIINALIVFDYDNPNNPDSIAIDADSGITVNSLLDQDPDAEDEDAMSNETNRKILTACISRMKHSEYGNLMPVPIDKDGNRIATDEYGHAVDQSKLILMYSDDDGNEVASVKQSATGRPDVMPDYEVIICNNVLGYAYKYEGEKWIDHQLGWTDEKAQEEANVYNADILIQELLEDKDFDAETLSVLKSKIVAIAQNYQDDLIMLERLMGASGSSEKRIARLIDKFYTGEIDTGWNRFWIKLGNYLTLSPTGTAKANNEVLELRTAKDMMLPDGKTIQTKNLAFILERGGYMLLLTVLACACAIVAAGLSAKIAANFSAIIRSQVFGKVETFSLIEFDKFSTASLITRSTNDINQIQTVFLLVLRTALIAPVTVIAGFIMSAAKSVPMTLTILYPFPILIVASVVAAKVVFPLFVVIQQKVDHLTLVAREGLTGIRVVRAFNRQKSENERFQKINDSLTKTAITVNRYCAILAPLIAVVMNCTMVGIVWVASKQIANNEDINVGDMMAVIQYITQIMLALVMLATVFVMFPRATASAKRINEVLETDLEILDPQNPVRSFPEVGSVRFDHVSFKYSKEAENNILTDIDFYAEKGKVTAIVGGTGSGKSSVINLIPRFYDVSEGSVSVDGVDVREIDQETLRAKVGFVPQRSVLFSGTIRSNLQYGKPDATEEEMWEALRIAQSDTFVREKENGLDSRVEQGGRNFSGGQKQRLAIARAIIRKPEVLIFDDSFSALDFRTDKRLRAALKEITKESATIIVAQRIGTIMDADNIIVLEEGKIVGQGVHADLISNCQLYRDIALSQMSEEELGL